MKVSTGRSQPEIAADIRLLNSVRGSGSSIFIPGFDYDSHGDGKASPIGHECCVLFKYQWEVAKIDKH